MYETVNVNKDSLNSELKNSVKTWLETKSESLVKAVNLDDGRYQNLVYRFYKEASSNAYNFMIHYEPERYLPKIEIPVLILNGGKDIQVPAKENSAGFKKHLVNSPKITSKVYPELNHMYQHCITCAPSEENTIEEVFAPEALSDISSWILNLYRSSTFN